MKRPTYRGRDPGRSAFTLLELLVVIVLGAIVLAILLPTIGKTRGDGSSKVKCAANLSSIYKAMYLYSTNDKLGRFPRTIYVPGAPPSFHYDNSDGSKPVNQFVDKPWAGYANDVTMAVFLVIRDQGITSEVFTCPFANAEKDTYGSAPGVTALNKASFSKPANLSYSFANMYPTAAVEKDGYKWDNSLSSEFAIAADQNPGVGNGYDVTLPIGPTAPGADMKKANSRNHNGTGQNVLYGDGHTIFEPNPFQGVKKDNIYTVGPDDTVTTSKVVVGPPGWYADSVLLPPYK